MATIKLVVLVMIVFVISWCGSSYNHVPAKKGINQVEKKLSFYQKDCIKNVIIIDSLLKTK